LARVILSPGCHPVPGVEIDDVTGRIEERKGRRKRGSRPDLLSRGG
jgi:hypothetical protein